MYRQVNLIGDYGTNALPGIKNAPYKGYINIARFMYFVLKNKKKLSWRWLLFLNANFDASLTCPVYIDID